MIHCNLFFSSFNLKEGGEGTEFLKRLQEIETHEQQEDDFNQEVDLIRCICICFARITFTYFGKCVRSIIHLIINTCVLNSFTFIDKNKNNLFFISLLVSASIETTKLW